MIPEGIKTEASDNIVTKNYVEDHLQMGIDALKKIIEDNRTVKHLKYDW